MRKSVVFTRYVYHIDLSLLLHMSLESSKIEAHQFRHTLNLNDAQDA